MIRLSIYALVISSLLAAFSMTGILGLPAANQEEDDKIRIPINDEHGISRRDFMRTKLMYSQNVFEGLTTGNFDLIKAGVKEVQAITEGEKWVEVDNDQYRKLTEDFKTATKRLSEAAASGNLEATALRYYQMSTSCIDCHKHIRKTGYQF
ncbi:MAG: hypothetical protein ACI87E_000790 [Mariniblastus sp.]|jgi:hypothetical protein